MKNSDFYQTLIIGAGISGITVAKHTNKRVKIIEKNSYIGGLSSQYSENGFNFDFGGHYFHFNNKERIKDYVKKYSVFNRYVKNSKVFLMNKFIPFPIQFHLSFLPQLIREQVFNEMMKHKENYNDFDNLDEYLLRIFGNRLHSLFFKPFLTKYYGEDLEKMAFNMDKGSIPAPTKKEILDGFNGKKFRNIGYNPVFYYPKKGLKNFIDNYSNSIKEKIVLNDEVIGIDTETKTVKTRKGSYKYGTLVNTIPLKEFINLLKDKSLHNKYYYKLKNISTEVVNIVLEKRRRKFHWVYLPENSFPFYRLGYYPKIKNTVCYIERTVSENDYLDISIKDIRKILKDLGVIENNNEIFFLSKKIIPVSYIIFDNEWKNIVPKILEILKIKDIYSIGRYGKWDYTSMSDDITDAMLIAEEINNGKNKT